MRPSTRRVEARRRSGEPGRSAATDDADLDARIVGLDALATEALRIEWRKLYRSEPPTRLRRDLLIRAIAYRIQECAHGGLSPGTRRRLRSLATEMTGNGGAVFCPGIAPKPGTKLVREWHGRAHRVTVLQEGFDYDGERYRSLSHVARRITGAHWSGPVFFGLERRSARALPVAEPGHG